MPILPLIFFLAPAHTADVYSLCAFLGLFILSMRAEAASCTKKSVHTWMFWNLVYGSLVSQSLCGSWHVIVLCSCVLNEGPS